MLSDPELVAIQAYGLLHPDGGIEGDIARPATFVVDRDGGVAWMKLADDWRVRPRPKELLEIVKELP